MPSAFAAVFLENKKWETHKKNAKKTSTITVLYCMYAYTKKRERAKFYILLHRSRALRVTIAIFSRAPSAPFYFPVLRLHRTNFPLYFIVVYTRTRKLCCVSVLNYRTIIHFFGEEFAYIHTLPSHRHPGNHPNSTPPTRLLLLLRPKCLYVEDSGMVLVMLLSEWCSTSA